MAGKDEEDSTIPKDKDMKKLRAIQKRALDRRRIEKDNKTLKALEEIDQLLGSQPAATSSANLIKEKKVKDACRDKCEIDDYAPGYQMLDTSLFGRIFTEGGLKLTDFVPAGTKLFGHNIITLDAQLFSKLITAKCYNLRSDPIGDVVGLYVVHLMACSPNPLLVRSCSEFLQHYRVRVTVDQFVMLLLNQGVTDANFDYAGLVVPQYLVSTQLGRQDFPTANIETLMDYLSLSVKDGLISCDSSVLPLISLLTKLALDGQIRKFELMANVIDTLSLLVSQCTTKVGPDEVARSILQDHDHPLNILEVCRLVVRPTVVLQRALLMEAMSRVIGHRASPPSTNTTKIAPKDLRDVVRACIDLVSTAHLKVFTALQLLIAVVPAVAMTKKEYDSCYKLLNSLMQATGETTADEVRTRGSAMHLRSLLMMSSVDTASGAATCLVMA